MFIGVKKNNMADYLHIAGINIVANMLVKLVRKAGINIKNEDFSSYDKMNREIEARLMI